MKKLGDLIPENEINEFYIDVLSPVQYIELQRELANINVSILDLPSASDISKNHDKWKSYPIIKAYDKWKAKHMPGIINTALTAT